MKLKKEYNIKYMRKFILISSFIFIGMFMFSSVSLAKFIDSSGPDTTTQNQNTSITDMCANNSFKTGLSGIVNYATCFLVKTIVPFLFALALVAFIWGVIQFYLNPENEEKRKKGKSFIVGGLIALFVMFSVWGLVGILTNTFFNGDSIPAPETPTLR